LAADVHNPFQVFGQLLVGIFIEEQGTLDTGLVHTGLNGVFGDLVKSHGVVDGGRGELGGIDDATLQRQVDFTAGQGADRGTQVVHDVHVPARGPDTHALEVFHFGGAFVGRQAHLLAALAAGKGEEVELAIQFLHHLQPPFSYNQML
jgi:hypothetical protein